MQWTLKTCIIFLIQYISVNGIREYKKDDILKLREEVREMFQHAYDSYLRYAYPYDELRPLSCDGVDTWGSYSLTLIDALDTLAIMGNYTEFNRVVGLVLERKDFDADINVSVFETNIRIIGGLLSAHLLSHKTGMKLEPGWPCNGPLLRLAEDAAQRLIAAFDTTTGMPYGTINLRNGVPPGETSVTCTAGVGTFVIEFGTLSRLTGDPLYEEVALNALKALYHHRSPIGLLGNHIDVQTGRWTAQDAGIGGGVDSYYEYLVKGAILLEKPELMSMFHEARKVVDKYLKKEDWYVWATMLKGQVTLPVFQSLEAYWPGVLSLIGESDTAMRIIHNYHSVWRQYGFTPEVYSLGAGEASNARESYPLRPELIESIMYLYRDTRDPILLQMGEDILRSIQHSARTICGYATIKDVRDHRKEDRMESFFLAETTKYLYLLFDPDNFIHNPGVKGKVIDTPNGECIVDVGGYIFNTEAHPIDPTMLHCCHEARGGINLTEVDRMYKLLDDEDNIQFMSFIDESDTNFTNDTNQDEPVNLLDIHIADLKNQIMQEIMKMENKVKARDEKTANLIEVVSNQDANEVIENNKNVKNTAIIIEVDKKTDLKNDIDSNSDERAKVIKTEIKTGYVNIDGSERNVNQSNISNIFKANNVSINNYSSYVDSLKTSIDKMNENSNENVKVDDIKVAEIHPIQPPSTTKAKEVFKLLPTVIQDFLNNDRKVKTKCEPQHILEKIRKEKRYPDHPDMDKYELLLTPAPSFLQRISLAGEFLNKKQLEV